MDIRGFCSDGCLFLASNCRHYAGALVILKCKLDPDYPRVSRFFPSLIYDSVYEWRTYGVTIVFGLVLSVIWSVIPEAMKTIVLVALILSYVDQTRVRAGYYRSNYEHWKQALIESPDKARVITMCAQWTIDESVRALEAGDMERHEELIREARRLHDRIETTYKG